jgi:hypothetical protein
MSERMPQNCKCHSIASQREPADGLPDCDARTIWFTRKGRVYKGGAIREVKIKTPANPNSF